MYLRREADQPSPRARHRRTRAVVAGLAALSLAASACSDGGGTTSPTAGGASTTTVDGTSTSPDGASTGDASSDTGGSSPGANDPSGSAALFDADAVHSISVSFDEGDYDEMIATYRESGDKTWIHASVTIDGVTYDDVGLRLKGNSSLRGLSGRGGPGGGPGGGGGGSTSSSTATPEALPWRIRLDKYVDGQNHQGYHDIVVRSNNSTTALNEAVALELLGEAGLATQAAAQVRFQVNGSDEVLRLIVELPDDDYWQEQAFDGAAGALYKADSDGDWSFRGDDPESYTDVFDQKGGDDVTDLTPLIELLQFINESDDDTFAAQLDRYLDVDSLATYLAMMDLVDNFDDISGPGNNAYLWWDASTERFTVVPWDLNLAFGAMGGGEGGGFPAGPQGGGFPGGGRGGMPTDRTLPDGVTLPDSGTPPDGDVPTPIGSAPTGGRPGIPGDRTRGGFGRRSNVLVDRFHDVPGFETRYDAALERLRADLFDSGTATETLDRWVSVLDAQASDLVDTATINSDADAIRTSIAKASAT